MADDVIVGRYSHQISPAARPLQKSLATLRVKQVFKAFSFVAVFELGFTVPVWVWELLV